MRALKSALMLFGATAVVAPAPGAAQQPQTPPSCEQSEKHREWDFWVGDWDVVSNDSARTTAGTNSIQSMHAGCMLLETWNSAGGGAGSSLNYYDPVRDEWRQLWVAPAYVIDIAGGLNDEGSMVLEGELRTFQTQQTSPFRGTWTLIEEDVVRQFFEIVNPQTGEWAPWFDGLYLKKGS